MTARPFVAFLADAALITLFAATGRASHDSDVLTGLWQTAWPFLAALVIGWTISRAWRAPFAPARTGVVVWVVVLAGGMALRALTGQGTALAFVIVAAVTLCLLLVGWRLLVAGVARLSRRRTTAQRAAS